jgi:hypothetical protein
MWCFSERKVRGVLNTKWTRFCETKLREEWFAKPRLMFLKFGGIWISAPQEGAGGMRGGDFLKK